MKNEDITDSQDELREIAMEYAHGECGAFAIACWDMFKEADWSLVLFKADGFPAHAACLTPSGEYFDAYGFSGGDQIQLRYKHDSWSSEQATDGQICAIMGCDDSDIDAASVAVRRLIELLISQGDAELHGTSPAPTQPKFKKPISP